MSETNDAAITQTLTIVLSQLEPGMSPDGMVSALQRFFPGKEPEVLRQALETLPLVLTRSATQAQANKVKTFLESKGAILKISDSSSPASQTKQAETEKRAGGEMPDAGNANKLRTRGKLQISATEGKSPAIILTSRFRP